MSNQNLPAQKTWEVKYQSDGIDVVLNESIIKNYLVRGKSDLVTKQEMAFFMGICKSRGLNPFAGDCYLIKYTQNDPAAIITSIDFKRARAKGNQDCQGWKKGIIVQTADGNVKDSAGLILDGEKLIGGWFEATPKGWAMPFRLEVNLKGYLKKTSEGTVTKFWKEENQPTMIAKVAESQGLSAVWPRDLGKLYTTEEMANEPQDITPLMDMENGKHWEGQDSNPSPSVDLFVSLAKAKIQGDKALSAAMNLYLTKSADVAKKTTDDVMVEASKDFEPFYSQFLAWKGVEDKKAANKGTKTGQEKKQAAPGSTQEEKKAEPPAGEQQTSQDEAGALNAGNGRKVQCPEEDAGELKSVSYCAEWCGQKDKCQAWR